MNIKEIFSKNKLKPYLTYSQNGNINRLFLSGNDIVVCETRDLQVKEVYFFSLNFITNDVYLRNFQLEEKWWVSIENVNDYTIFFHSFKRPDLPEPLGIKAVDIKSGNLKWENKELIFFFATNENAYAFKQLFEKKVFYRLNALTGEIEEEYKDDSFAASLSLLKDENERRQFLDCLYTEAFNPSFHKNNNEVNMYLSKRFHNSNISGEVEYIKHRGYLVYNFHAQKGINLKNLNEAFFSNYLEIYDLTGKKIVFKDTLNDEVPSFVPDSFLIKRDFLFYVREKKELVIINLK